MGYDISYHPVDPSFFHGQLIPIVRGEGSGDELFERAARIAKVRFVANAWGLAVQSIATDRSLEPPVDVGHFNPDLHVWGRPFFITVEGEDEVSATIDRYLAADRDGADSIASEMAGRVSPALLEARSNNGSPLLRERVASELRRMPSDEAFLDRVTWKIDLFRDAYAARASHRPVRDQNGDTLDPDEMFATDFALAMLEFAAIFRPGWMDRGTVWPTRLLSKARLAPTRYFTSAEPLFAPLLDEVPPIRESLKRTITENYSLGGYVAPDRAPALLQRVRERYVRPGRPVAVHVRKLIEALHDAARRGLGFVEASEVYNAATGMAN